MSEVDVEIIDTHVHAQPSLTDVETPPDRLALAEVFSECRHPVRLVVSCSESSPVLTGGRNVTMMRSLGRVVRALPERFIGALMVEPHATDDALEAIELGVREYGLRLVGEQCQYVHGYRTDGPEMLPIVQRAVDLDVAVSFHITSERHAERLGRLAERFPRARFLAAHYAGGRSWRRGLRTLKQHANVSVEIQAVEPERIAGTLDAVGARRITIGTDFFLHGRDDCRYRRGDRIVDCLRALKVCEVDIARICSGNAREFLKCEG